MLDNVKTTRLSANKIQSSAVEKLSRELTAEYTSRQGDIDVCSVQPTKKDT